MAGLWNILLTLVIESLRRLTATTLGLSELARRIPSQNKCRRDGPYRNGAHTRLLVRGWFFTLIFYNSSFIDLGYVYEARIYRKRMRNIMSRMVEMQAQGIDAIVFSC